MIRVYLWAGLTLVTLLCVMVAAVYEPAARAELRKAPETLSHGFNLGGVFVPVSDTVPALSRDPFTFAPLAAEVPGVAMAGSAPPADFAEMRLEGVLLRKGDEHAFVRVGGRRYSVGIGEALDNGVRVESIDRDGVVVSNGFGESRRLYLPR